LTFSSSKRNNLGRACVASFGDTHDRYSSESLVKMGTQTRPVLREPHVAIDDDNIRARSAGQHAQEAGKLTEVELSGLVRSDVVKSH
jgi:hypothetical protein